MQMTNVIECCYKPDFQYCQLPLQGNSIALEVTIIPHAELLVNYHNIPGP